MNFCHITPTRYLDIFASERKTHLLLAHLVEEDEAYAKWYKQEKESCGCELILDNSAFEMYSRNLPMYESSKLVNLARKVNADYVVLTDYPGEPAQKTIDKAIEMYPEIRANGFKTFFCPQSEPGNLEELKETFLWASESQYVDMIGFSILAIPMAYGVNKDNKFHSMLARWRFLEELRSTEFFQNVKRYDKKLHMLGMLDGPNEIYLVRDFITKFNSWDSSAAVWAGINGIAFDNSPTGLANGKVKQHVDFSHNSATIDDIALAIKNTKVIDNLVLKATRDGR